MTGDEIRAERVRLNGIEVWEFSLKPGDPVEARWTNSYTGYVHPAEVVRVNRKSVRIRLLKDIHVGGRLVYEAGREFSLPRVWSAEWSMNNCVLPRREKK